ncbi:MAG: hypothetical protein M1821_000012 [Bathelium mastoideum]|nr:MAG: hypothetical protein M1821_000012 [Bathelium mastoideum]
MPLEPRQTTIAAPYVVPPSQEFDGDKGSWSTFSISVGSPPQDFRVLVSTASSETWIPVAQGCTQYDVSNCPQLRGVGLFNGVQNPGFETNQSSTWSLIGLYGVNTEQRLNITGNGLQGYDTIQLGSSQDTSALSAGHSVVAAVPDKDLFLGELGLGIQPLSFSSASAPIPSLLQSLKTSNQIPSLSFSYTAGNPYRLKKVDGSLILGGYDSTRFVPNNLSFTFASEDAAALTVGVQSIIASNSFQGVQSFTTTGYLSVVDSSVDELWLPEAVCDMMANAFGLIHDPESDLYVINDTVHSQLQQMNPNITFQLGNTAYNNGNSTNIILPYSAFDMQASWPIFQSSYNYFPIRRAANDTQYTIGRTLLQEAYLIVDYERQNFSISQAAWPDPLPSPQIEMIRSINTTSASPNTTATEKSLSTGAIAGIAVGGAAALLVIAIAIFLLFRRRRQNRHRVVPGGSNFWTDQKSSVGNETHNAGQPQHLDGSFYSPERKDTLRSRQNAQELEGNDFGELDGQGVLRSELPTGKPEQGLGGSDRQIYEMSSDGSETWNSGTQTSMTRTFSSPSGTQGATSPRHIMGLRSLQGGQNGSPHESQWGPSPYGSQHGSSTLSTRGATYSSQQSTPYELP